MSTSDDHPDNDDVDDGDGDDLLYGDLSDTKPAAVSKSVSHEVKRIAASDSISNESAIRMVQELQKQVDNLEEENRRLKRNIGTLYRTAKAEIKRKDDEIARLLHELEQLKNDISVRLI